MTRRQWLKQFEMPGEYHEFLAMSLLEPVGHEKLCWLVANIIYGLSKGQVPFHSLMHTPPPTVEQAEFQLENWLLRNKRFMNVEQRN